MPIRKEWSEFNPESVSAVPETDGVYELASDQDTIIYIAGTPNLRQALEENLNSEEPCLKEARLFRCEETFMYTMRESELISQFLRRNGRMPRCNEEII